MDDSAHAMKPAGTNGHEPFRNHRGIIAESYYELQGLAMLEAARQEHPLPRASPESTLRAVLQAAEIALLNLADLMKRAERDITDGDFNRATVIMFWARGFHRLLNRLSLMPAQLAFPAGENATALHVKDSPAYAELLEELQRFDCAALQNIESGRIRAQQAIADESLDSATFNLLHLIRICNHEASVWERNLTNVVVPAEVSSYADFVVSSRMRDAVYDRILTGDTYFTQFRGLHQAPEILGEEINDRVEEAIRKILIGRFDSAIDQLMAADTLSEGVLAALPPIVDNLATTDYHEIRENLGLTSGSHSVCLRFHMFTQLYEQLAEVVKTHVTPARTVEDDGTATGGAWEAGTLEILVLKLRSFIYYWRDQHINLPRNNLGGNATKSLTGSPDAVQAVIHMRDTARSRDPLVGVAQARTAAEQVVTGQGALAGRFARPSSLDARILDITGAVTQARFRDVQERLGVFANRCPFSPPPRRQA